MSPFLNEHLRRTLAGRWLRFFKPALTPLTRPGVGFVLKSSVQRHRGPHDASSGPAHPEWLRFFRRFRSWPEAGRL